MAEGLETVGAEIHRGLDQRTRDTAEPCHGVVVDHDHAEGRVTEHDGPEAENGISARLKAERSEMPVMTPGRAIGRITRSEIASRPKNFVCEIAAAHSVPSTSAITVEIEATRTDRRQRFPDIGPVPGHGKPF
jgi:hypothetical protein